MAIPRRLILFLFFILTLFACLLIPVQNVQEYVDVPKVNEIASKTIVAPFTFEILKSEEELSREREEAGQKVLAIFQYDEVVTEKAYSGLKDLEQKITLLVSPNLSDSSRKKISEELCKTISAKSVSTLKNNPRLLEEIRNSSDNILDSGITAVYIAKSAKAMEDYTRQYRLHEPAYLIYDKDYVTILRDSLRATVSVSALFTKEMALEKETRRFRAKWNDPLVWEAFSEVLYNTAVPNVFYNATETARLKESEAALVALSKGKVVQGTVIVEANTAVTADVVEKLRSLVAARRARANLQSFFWRISPFVFNFFIAGFLLFAFALFLRLMQRPLFNNQRKMFTLACVFLLTLAVIRFFMFVFSKPLFDFFAAPEYGIPFFAGTLVLTLILGLPAGLIFNLFVSLFAGIMLGFDLKAMMYAFLAGSFAAVVLSSVKTRIHMFMILIVWLAFSIAYFILLDFMRGDMAINRLISNVEISLVGGLLSILFALPYGPFERIAGELSALSLSKYLGLDFPLLRRLSQEAPGTFQHSLHVANLTAAGARSIGESQVLARLLAFYHDIGKILRPNYFSENGPSRELYNQNADSVDAFRSIIASHVRDGVRLAVDYHLPSLIRNAILETHGTNAVLFAKSDHLNSGSEGSEWLYPGPKPHTKINALLMLANTFEMTIRFGRFRLESELRAMARQKLFQILSLGQLEECNISFAELSVAVEAMIPELVRVANLICTPQKAGETEQEEEKVER